MLLTLLNKAAAVIPESGLIVESGTGSATANSYVNLVYARAFASSVGLALPTDDVELTQALLSAMAYIESQPYTGRRLTTTQALEWPRADATYNYSPIANGTIPLTLMKAQVQAAALIGSGVDLFETLSGQFVTREKVGPIETEYSSEYLATVNGLTQFGAIDIYLKPLTNWRSGYRLSPAFGF